MAPVLATLPLQVMCQLVMPAIPRCENTSIAVNISTSPIKPAETLPFGFIAYPEMDTAYKFHDENVSWLTARKLCISEGAQLALIDTPKKLKFIKDRRPTATFVHVGIHSLFEKNDWVSVKDGAPVSTPQWRSGRQPPNAVDYRCGMLDEAGTGITNYNCSGQIGYYVCELPIPKS